MGLKGDFSELGSVWRTSPWRVKALLLFSGFLATASIASLAESVSKWKGFILTGVTLYREVVSQPAASLLSSVFALRINYLWLDFFTIAALTLGAFARGLFIQLHIDRSKENRINSYAILASMPLLLFFVIYRAATSPAGSAPSLLGAVGAYVFTFFWRFVPPRRAYDLVIQVYLIVPPLIVGILAAVNAGLK